MPTLREAFETCPESAAEVMMIVVGDNLSRLLSDVAFGKLCGAWPIGVTNRHRLFRGGPPPSQRDAAPDRDRPHALVPADP